MTRDEKLSAALAAIEERRAQALGLLEFEATPIQTGKSAGGRTEGTEWAKAMRACLERPGYRIETTTGKSSSGTKLDGNAHERIAFKMMTFKMDPLQSDQNLVIAMNAAFQKYKPHFYAEIVSMAGSLNARSSGNPVIVLGAAKTYNDYFDRWRRDVQRSYSTDAH